jgi:hypothetical protein
LLDEIDASRVEYAEKQAQINNILGEVNQQEQLTE